MKEIKQFKINNNVNNNSQYNLINSVIWHFSKPMSILLHIVSSHLSHACFGLVCKYQTSLNDILRCNHSSLPCIGKGEKYIHETRRKEENIQCGQEE